MPGNALNHMPEVDFLCRGEGEIVMMNLCRTLERNGDFNEVRGICFRSENGVSETCRPVTPESLEEYPSPYLDGTIDVTNRTKAILLTSRGCNWDCHFCYTPNATSRKVRYHSVNQVIEEMKFLKQRGVSYFWFADPLFSANPSRLKELLNRIISEVPGITFWCECRCEVMNQEIFELMKKAGCVKVAFGLESASPKVLKIMNKRLDLDKLSHAVALAQNTGIEVELFSIFGLPGETFTDAMETIDFVKRHDIRITGNSGSQKMSIYFGTEFQWNFDKYGILPDGVTKPLYKSIGSDFSTDLLSSDDLTRISFAWKLQEMSNAPSEDVIFSLDKILKHQKLLSDQPAFHHVLYKAYITLQEYRLAFQALKTLITEFPESEYVRRIGREEVTVYQNAVCDRQRNDLVIYATESADSNNFQIHQQRYEDLPAGLMKKMNRQPTKTKGIFSTKSSDGNKQKFRFEILTILRARRVPSLEELESITPAVYSSQLVRNEVFDQNNLLFYFGLRSLPLDAILQDKELLLFLANFYLNFGLMEKAQQLINLCASKFALDLAEICVLNSQPALALNLLERTRSKSTKVRLLKIESLIQLNQLDSIEIELEKVKSADKIKTYELWLNVISKKRMPIETYITHLNNLIDAKLAQMQ
jgi:hypothetical protein